MATPTSRAIKTLPVCYCCVLTVTVRNHVIVGFAILPYRTMLDGLEETDDSDGGIFSCNVTACMGIETESLYTLVVYAQFPRLVPDILKLL